MQEFSYGIVPLKHSPEHVWEVLLVKHRAGHWAFPKGHPNPGESPQVTAARELQEETGLHIKRIFSDQPILKENYFFLWNKKKIFKTVEYFIAEVEGKVVLQEAEVADSRWVTIDQAVELMTFEEGKKMCRGVKLFLHAH